MNKIIVCFARMRVCGYWKRILCSNSLCSPQHIICPRDILLSHKFRLISFISTMVEILYKTSGCARFARAPLDGHLWGTTPTLINYRHYIKLKGLWEIPWGLLGENILRSRFLHSCNHCHHTNDHLKPFALIQCPSRDIVWNVWFHELIFGSTD